MRTSLQIQNAVPKSAQPSVKPGARPAAFYRPATYCAEESVGYLMKRIVLSIVQQADLRLDAHGLTSAQWGPLMRLKTAGRSTVVDLARWQHVDPGAMTRLLDRLEKKSLVKRERCTEDRRVVLVELTAEGATAIAEVPAVLSAVMNAHLAGFSKDEWLVMKACLQRMVDNGDALRASAE